MKIIIIRHGDPVYGSNETLTEQGFKEVKALGEMYKDIKYTEAFTSPLPRAKLTEEALLGPSGRKATVMPWLEEFSRLIQLPGQKEKKITWDFLPRFFEKHKKFYDKDKYMDYLFFKKAHIKEEYEEVTKNFEAILNKHGYYKKNGLFYTKKGNNDVLLFICHAGMMAVLLSYLLNIPYVLIMQKCGCPTSGVTTLYTEEREEGIAQFRLQSFGDISHLKAKGLEPSFAVRFCETFDSPDRHD